MKRSVTRMRQELLVFPVVIQRERDEDDSHWYEDPEQRIDAKTESTETGTHHECSEVY